LNTHDFLWSSDGTAVVNTAGPLPISSQTSAWEVTLAEVGDTYLLTACWPVTTISSFTQGGMTPIDYTNGGYSVCVPFDPFAATLTGSDWSGSVYAPTGYTSIADSAYITVMLWVQVVSTHNGSAPGPVQVGIGFAGSPTWSLGNPSHVTLGIIKMPLLV